VIEFVQKRKRRRGGEEEEEEKKRRRRSVHPERSRGGPESTRHERSLE
jgi:hypothetical protein